jgi:hypothetical protein
LTAALADLSARMRTVASAEWMADFEEAIRELFVGYVWETINRENGLRPSLEAYLRMRRTTIGLQPQFLLGELAEGIELPRPVKADPLLDRLMVATCNCVGWANDLFTYEKESAVGEFHNAVLLMAGHCSMNDALSRVARLHNQEVKIFLQVKKELPSFGDADEHVCRFVRMLESWMRGHLDWAQETGRYRPRATVPERARV